MVYWQDPDPIPLEEVSPEGLPPAVREMLASRLAAELLNEIDKLKGEST
jgi:hypothetical protein